jgi:hypothetical protein
VQVLGVFILIWCWFSFNAGSTTSVSNGADRVAALAAANTAMASGCGSVAGMFFSWYRSRGKYIDVYETANGALCGLVGITAGCASVQPWEAGIIGIIAALAGNSMSGVLVSLRIDDPVGVVPVHLMSGIFGVLCVGLFANDPALTPDLPVPQSRPGLFHGGGFDLLGVQVLVMLFIFAWAGILFTALVFLLDATMGLRVTAEEEKMLDALEHNLLMVKVQEEFGGSTFSESEIDIAERGIAMAMRSASGRVLQTPGQIMTLDGGLDHQPGGLTVRPRRTSIGTANTEASSQPPLNGIGSLAPAAREGTFPADPTAASGSSHMPHMAVTSSQGQGRRRSSRRGSSRSHGPRRSASGAHGRGRRRSVTYHTEEVTYMTAEELNAAKEGRMDGTDTMDESIPAAVSGQMEAVAAITEGSSIKQTLAAPPAITQGSSLSPPQAASRLHQMVTANRNGSAAHSAQSPEATGLATDSSTDDAAIASVSRMVPGYAPVRTQTAVVPISVASAPAHGIHAGGAVIPTRGGTDGAAASRGAPPDTSSGGAATGKAGDRPHRKKHRGHLGKKKSFSQPMGWQAPRGPSAATAAASTRAEGHLEYSQPRDTGACQQQ